MNNHRKPQQTSPYLPPLPPPPHSSSPPIEDIDESPPTTDVPRPNTYHHNPTIPTKGRHQTTTTPPSFTAIEINPNVDLTPLPVVTSPHSILEHTTRAVFKPYKVPTLRGTASAPAIGSSPTREKSMYGGVGAVMLGNRRKLVKRDGGKIDLMGLEEEMEGDMVEGKGREGGDVEKEDDPFRGNGEGRNHVPVQPSGAEITGGLIERYSNQNQNRVHHKQQQIQPPYNNHSSYSPQQQHRTAHNQASTPPQQPRTQQYNQQPEKKYQPSHERQSQVDVEEQVEYQNNVQMRSRNDGARDQQYQPALATPRDLYNAILQRPRSNETHPTPRQPIQNDQYRSAYPPQYAQQQVSESYEQRAQQPNTVRGQFARPQQHEQPRQQFNDPPQQYQSPQRQERSPQSHNQNPEAAQVPVLFAPRGLSNPETSRADQPQEYTTYPTVLPLRRQVVSRPVVAQQAELPKPAEQNARPPTQAEEKDQEKKDDAGEMEVDEPEEPFDPTAPVPRYDSQTELVQKWDKIQADLQPVLKAFCEDMLRSTYDIIYATLYRFQTINRKAQDNLRAGVASIEAEEDKQEEARKVIAAFSEEMQRVAEVLGKFGSTNIGLPFPQ